MKKNYLIIICVLQVILIFCIGFGVFAVKNINMNASGTMKFVATKITCEITATVFNAYDSAGVLQTISCNRNSSDEGSDLTSWNLSDLYFNSSIPNNVDEVDDIVISFAITNTSDYSAYAYFTKNGEKIVSDSFGEDVVSVALENGIYLPRAEEETENTKTLSITFSLQKWESFDVGFNYTLNIYNYNSLSNEEDAFDVEDDELIGFDPLTIGSEVYIPDTVKSISNNAFYGCSAMETLVMPDSVITIGKSAFSGCSNLKNITFSNFLKEIGNQAFYECYNLTDIVLPASLQTIGVDVFYYCSINTLTIDDENIYFNSVNNCIMNESNTTVVLACDGFTGFPNGVTSIGPCAFSTVNSSAISIPSTVQTIGELAYAESSLSGDIIIPNTVQSIGNFAFAKTDITSVSFANNNILSSISNSMFYDCSELTLAVLSDNITVIGNSAFSNCSSLSIINIPTGIASVEAYAFNSCSFDEITISGNTSFGSNVFLYCNINKVFLKSDTNHNFYTDLHNLFNGSNVKELIVSSEIQNTYASCLNINTLEHIVLNVHNGMSWYKGGASGFTKIQDGTLEYTYAQFVSACGGYDLKQQ